MKKAKASPITLMQFVMIIHGCQVGTGIFSLPRTLSNKAGTDGWISLIIAWIINLIVSIIIVKTFEKYPNDTILDLLMRLFGKVMGKIMTVPIILYYAFFAWTILSITVLFIKQWFLQMTADYIVMLLLIVPGFFIAPKSIQILGRYAELVFYMTFWMFFLLFIPLGDSHWIHLLPIIKEGWMPIIHGVGEATFSFLGFEILFVMYPFLKEKHLAVRGVITANTITLLLYLLVTLICFSYFSPDGITDYNDPLFNLLKMIELPFLERFDMIFLAMYLIIISTAWLPYFFGVVYNTSQILHIQKKFPLVVCLLLPIVLFTLILHPSWTEVDSWIELVTKVGIWISYVFPVFLFLYVLLYSRVKRGVGK